jgi:hypothetical protein
VQPRFKHDCDDAKCCQFLETVLDHDIYLHPRDKRVIARYGDEGSNYWVMYKDDLARFVIRKNWHANVQTQAMVIALFRHQIGAPPPAAEQQKDKYTSIHDVKLAVSKLRWDMLFSPSSDVVPDPAWGLEADTAFQHFYIARALLEQAEHHLGIAEAHDRECWKKYRALRERQEGTNGGN